MDRLPGNELLVTHELIAGALGVRRESVTQAILKLRSQGCIAYGRKSITVLDRGTLEARSCECYSAIRSECDRLAPDRPAVGQRDGPALRTMAHMHSYAE